MTATLPDDFARMTDEQLLALPDCPAILRDGTVRHCRPDAVDIAWAKSEMAIEAKSDLEQARR